MLQIINLVCGLGMFALEWPLSFIAGSAIHRSLEVRLAILPLTALSAILLYQATNAGLYYLIGMVVYFTAYSEGEVSITGPTPTPKTYPLTIPSDHLRAAVDPAEEGERAWGQGVISAEQAITSLLLVVSAHSMGETDTFVAILF